MHRLIILLFFCAGLQGLAQTEITWKTLQDIKFSEKYSIEEEAYYYFPHFGPSVKVLEGKEVLLKGYLLAIEPRDNYYLLSRYPMASCFFCGNGGPETIVELKLDPGKQRLKMDDIVTIKGKLKLNDDDIYQCNYIFEVAEVHQKH